jgi:hypothetical protein
LRSAALRALALDRCVVRDYALRYSWHAATGQFASNLTRQGGARRSASGVATASGPSPAESGRDRILSSRLNRGVRNR